MGQLPEIHPYTKDHVIRKYGDYPAMGWSPRRRFDYGYILPGDIYECYIDRLITGKTKWLDVGGGRSVLPHNPDLSRELSCRCLSLTSVDPSDNVFDNPFAHKRIRSLFEHMDVVEKYNLIKFRMVAEHVNNPVEVVSKLGSCIETGGLVVIYTINKYCPIPLITRWTPFSLHHKIKKVFWGGEEKDTFPIAYKMNSKKELSKLFVHGGEYEELVFQYLDDVSATVEFRYLNALEMLLWSLLNKKRIKYIENNIFAVYRKV